MSNIKLPYPSIISDYSEWYEIQRANIEYTLRQKLFNEIRDRMIQDFIERGEPLIREMVDDIVVAGYQSQRNLDKMRDDINIKVILNIEKITKV